MRLTRGTVGEMADAPSYRGWFFRRRPHVGSYHVWLKKRARRLFRRLARQDPENAPTKYRYRGWET